MRKIILSLLLALCSSGRADPIGERDGQIEEKVTLGEMLMGADTFADASKVAGDHPSLTTLLSEENPSMWELASQSESEESTESHDPDSEGDDNATRDSRECHFDAYETDNERRDREFMQAIQLGIAASVRGSPAGAGGEITGRDYQLFDTITFERTDAGDPRSPKEFKFQTLAAKPFSSLRQLFGVSDAEYLESIGDPVEKRLRILGNPGGASESSFYMTHDGLYIVKTMRYRQAKFLGQILHKYHTNLRENSRGTLLPKLFGQYCYLTSGCHRKHLCLVVMNNLLPTSVRMQQKYDLKGSKVHRRAPEKELVKSLPAFRDLDFLDQHEEGFELEPEVYDALMKTIESDTNILLDFKIYDYSLLLGVRALDGADDQQLPAAQGLQRGATNTWGPIPARNSAGQRVLLYAGIVDFLQDFHIGRKLEFVYKAMLHDSESISVNSPQFYARRFRDFMGTRVFKRAD